MTMDVVSYLLFGAMGLVILGPFTYRTYAVPREILLALVGIGLVLYWLLYDTTFYLMPETTTAVLLLIGWWTVCSILARDKDRSLRYLFLFIVSVLVTAFLQPASRVLGFQILVGVATASSLLGIHQWYRIKTGSKKKFYDRPWGLSGNPNYFGAYLLPHVFLGLWLTWKIQYAWFFPTFLIICVMVLTRCRAAIVGMLAGLIALAAFMKSAESYFLLGVVGLISFLLGVWHRDKLLSRDTPKERFNYWRVGLYQIIRTPIFGVGFENFRRKIAHIQVRLNEKTGGKFLSKDNYYMPCPENVHNDYLQHIIDTGFPGLLLIGYLIYQAFSRVQDPFIAAGLISMIICGLFFYCFYVMEINLLFWLFVFESQRLNIGLKYEVGNVELALGIILAIGTIYYVLKFAVYDFLFNKYKTTGNSSALMFLDRLTPKDSSFHNEASRITFAQGQTLPLLFHCIRALDNYDGEKRIWELWFNLGLAFSLLGVYQVSEFCYKMSLKYWPEYAQAKSGLKSLKKMTEVNKK